MNIQNTNMSLNKIIDELIILFKKEFNSLIVKAEEKIKESQKVLSYITL